MLDKRLHTAIVHLTCCASLGAITLAGASERVRFESALVPRLLATELEGSILVPSWPVAPGARADLLLTRHDVYSPEAIVYRLEGKERVEAPRSRLRFLWGYALDDERTPVLLAVDPDTSLLHGYSGTASGSSEVRPALDLDGDYVVWSEEELAKSAEGPPEWSCGQTGAPPDPLGVTPESERPEAITSLHRITLAIDTDNELLALKFGDDATAATNYVASLVALLSTIYERDLLVRILQGTTLLRVSTAGDPFVQSGTGNVDLAKLGEFKNWWVANEAGVPRATALLLSGKQASPNSASGMSYIDTLCSATFGYSFAQVFKYAGSTAGSDLKLIAHEIGHTFGSAHTHCYTSPTPIDTCYSGEGSCYSGATACPAATTINGVPNVRGTLMSYCHVLSGCSASTVFHPRTVAILAPKVESKVGVCAFPLATPQETSPAEDMRVERSGGTVVTATYAPACGASGHTVYTGSLDTLRTGGIAWSGRHCSLGTSGRLSFDPGAGNVYFVVVGNSAATEGSYGRGSAGERPAAGSGGGCSYVQSLGGTCP